jgi:transcriptional regulator with XRE-family HTH domain
MSGKNNLGERIKSLIKICGYRQIEFSLSLGLSKNTMFYYLSDRRNPRSDTIKKIAEKCDVNLEWLTTGKIIPALLYTRFKELHDSTALSTKDFAAALNKPESYIEAIENGDIYPSEEFLENARKTFKKNRDFYLARNVLNVQEERTKYFNEQYPELISWISENDEFKMDLDGLVNRWRRIKSLEQKHQ